MANYSSVSLLPVFVKVFEKVAYHILNHHLQTNNVHTPEQYGFWKSLN
jgi:hypothetical protein